MKKLSIHSVLLVLFTIGVTTGAYTQVISPLQTHKRVIVEFHDGTIVKGKNATLYADSLIFNKNESYQLSQIKSFKHSDTNHGFVGAVLGFIGAIGVIKIIDRSSDITYEDTGFVYGTMFVVPFFVTLLGYNIGSNIYTEWQNYDPSSLDAEKQAMTFNIHNKSFMVGYKIPLR